MHTILVGLNHNKASVEVREKIHFSENILPQALKKLVSKYKEIQGAVIISTCNRVEVYASAKDKEQGIRNIIDFIADYHSISHQELKGYLYKKHCHSAVKHLFKVVAGLNSMVVGEFEIQGQVKTAYHIAEKSSTVDILLNKLFQTAIQAGKKSRSKTNLSDGAVSIGSIVAELLKDFFTPQQKVKILLIGAGKISKVVIKNILKTFVKSELCFANRTEEKTQKLAKTYGGCVFQFDNIIEQLNNFDVVVTATGSKTYIINKKHLQNISTKHKKTYFIDIAVPRNIDPHINTLNNVELYSMDDFERLIDKNLLRRKAETDKVEKIIDQIFEEYYEWYNLQTVVPVMKKLKIEFDNMVETTLHTYEPDLRNMTDTQKKIVKKLIKNHSDKIIKIIMQNLRQVAKPSELFNIGSALQRTFNIKIDDELSAN